MTGRVKGIGIAARRVALGVIAAFFLLSIPPPATAKGEATVTTGAGYKTMVEFLAAAFRASGGKIEEAYGGHIGHIVAQISQGSGATVVISDQGTLEDVASLSTFSKFVPLGETPLVLAWRKGATLNSPEDLADKKFERVAHPDPQGAIYGRAAAAYLKSSGLLDKLGDRIMAVSTVPQVMAYLTAGEIDAGFVNRASVRSAGDKIGGSMEITTGYPPIHMVAAVVAGTENDPETKAFVEFLGSDKAKAILREYGVWL
jgi:molybdate transport system substrate-binding protein